MNNILSNYTSTPQTLPLPTTASPTTTTNSSSRSATNAVIPIPLSTTTSATTFINPPSIPATGSNPHLTSTSSWAHHNINLLAATAASSPHSSTATPTPTTSTTTPSSPSAATANPQNSNNSISHLQYQQHLHPAHHLYHHHSSLQNFQQQADHHHTTNRPSAGAASNSTSSGGSFINNNNNSSNLSTATNKNNSTLNIFDSISSATSLPGFPTSAVSAGAAGKGVTGYNNTNLHLSASSTSSPSSSALFQQSFLNQRTNHSGPTPYSLLPTQQAAHLTSVPSSGCNNINNNSNTNKTNHPVVSLCSTATTAPVPTAHSVTSEPTSKQTSLFTSAASPMTHQPHAYVYNPSPSISGSQQQQQQPPSPYNINRPQIPLTKPPSTSSQLLLSPSKLSSTSNSATTASPSTANNSLAHNYSQPQSFSTTSGGGSNSGLLQQQQHYLHHNTSKPSPGQYSNLPLPSIHNQHNSNSSPSKWSSNIMSYPPPPIGSSSANQAHHQMMNNMTTTSTTTPNLRPPYVTVTTPSGIPTSFHSNNNTNANNSSSSSNNNNNNNNSNNNSNHNGSQPTTNYHDMLSINRFTMPTSHLVPHSSHENINFHQQQQSQQHPVNLRPPLTIPTPSHISPSITGAANNNRMPPPSHSPQIAFSPMLDNKQNHPKVLDVMSLPEDQRSLFRHHFSNGTFAQNFPDYVRLLISNELILEPAEFSFVNYINRANQLSPQEWQAIYEAKLQCTIRSQNIHDYLQAMQKTSYLMPSKQQSSPLASNTQQSGGNGPDMGNRQFEKTSPAAHSASSSSSNQSRLIASSAAMTPSKDCFKDAGHLATQSYQKRSSPMPHPASMGAPSATNSFNISDNQHRSQSFHMQPAELNHLRQLSLQQSPHSQLPHPSTLLSHSRDKQQHLSMMNLPGSGNIGGGDSRQNNSPQSNFQQPPAAHQSSKTPSCVNMGPYYKQPSSLKSASPHILSSSLPGTPAPLDIPGSNNNNTNKLSPSPIAHMTMKELELKMQQQHRYQTNESHQYNNSNPLLGLMSNPCSQPIPANMSTYEFLAQQKKLSEEQSRLQNTNLTNRTRAHTPLSAYPTSGLTNPLENFQSPQGSFSNYDPFQATGSNNSRYSQQQQHNKSSPMPPIASSASLASDNLPKASRNIPKHSHQSSPYVQPMIDPKYTAPFKPNSQQMASDMSLNLTKQTHNIHSPNIPQSNSIVAHNNFIDNFSPNSDLSSGLNLKLPKSQNNQPTSMHSPMQSIGSMNQNQIDFSPNNRLHNQSMQSNNTSNISATGVTKSIVSGASARKSTKKQSAKQQQQQLKNNSAVPNLADKSNPSSIKISNHPLTSATPASSSLSQQEMEQQQAKLFMSQISAAAAAAATTVASNDTIRSSTMLHQGHHDENISRTPLSHNLGHQTPLGHPYERPSDENFLKNSDFTQHKPILAPNDPHGSFPLTKPSNSKEDTSKSKSCPSAQQSKASVTSHLHENIKPDDSMLEYIRNSKQHQQFPSTATIQHMATVPPPPPQPPHPSESFDFNNTLPTKTPTTKSEIVEISKDQERDQLPVKTEWNNNKQPTSHSISAGFPISSSVVYVAPPIVTSNDLKFSSSNLTTTSATSNSITGDPVAPAIATQSFTTSDGGNVPIHQHATNHETHLSTITTNHDSVKSASATSSATNVETVNSNNGELIKQEIPDQPQVNIKAEDINNQSQAIHSKVTDNSIEQAPKLVPAATLAVVQPTPVSSLAPATPAPPVVSTSSSAYSSAACKKKQWINRYHQEDDSSNPIASSSETTNQQADSKNSLVANKPTVVTNSDTSAQIKTTENSHDMVTKVKNETSKSNRPPPSTKVIENDQARLLAKPLGSKKTDAAKCAKDSKAKTSPNKRVKSESTEASQAENEDCTTSSASDSESCPIKPPEKKARRMPTRRITSKTNTTITSNTNTVTNPSNNPTESLESKKTHFAESSIKAKPSRTRNRDSRLDEIRRRLKSTSGNVLPLVKPKRPSVASAKRQTRQQQVTKDEANQETDDSMADHSTDIEEEDASNTTSTTPSGNKSNTKPNTNKGITTPGGTRQPDSNTKPKSRGSTNSGENETNASTKKKFKSSEKSNNSSMSASDIKEPTKVSQSAGQNQNYDSEMRRTMAIHKRNGETFLQKQSCVDVDPDIKVPRCLECRQTRHSNNQKNDRSVSNRQRTNWFCRFYEFRKLKYKTPTQLVTAGFSEPTDADNADELIWSLKTDDLPPNINEKIAKFIVDHIGDQFCDIVMQERDAKTLYSRHREGTTKPIIWKRAVNGVREMCDVCATTLFNRHFGCEKCGFVVCIDCYKTKALHPSSNENLNLVNSPDHSDSVIVKIQPDKDSSESTKPVEDKDTVAVVVPSATAVQSKNRRDNFNWISCAKNKFHSHRNLVLIQIIAGDSLDQIWNILHKVRASWSPKNNCICDQGRENQEPDSQSRLLISLPSANRQELSAVQVDNRPVMKSQLNQQASSDEDTTDHSTLRGLLLDQIPPAITQTNPPTVAVLNSTTNQVGSPDLTCQSSPKSDADTQKKDSDNCKSEKISSTTSKASSDDGSKCEPSYTWCDNELLVLLHPRHKDNLKLFRAQWKLGKPILVRGMDKLTNLDLWVPQYFSEKFGFYRNDLIDCRYDSIHKHSMKKYWDNFENHYGCQKKNKKINNSSGPPQPNSDDNSASNSSISNSGANLTPGSFPLWKMKDWPPSEDFGEILPEHYKDYMDNLPLSSYTTRSGQLNLACRIPNEMLKPDLGPKLYSAYGTPKFSHKGTTNLHLDVSDAINVMMYVGGAKAYGEGSVEQEEFYNEIISSSDIDQSMKNVIRRNKGCPGALWHIFKQSDASALRTFLNKIAEERNINSNLRADPIHDQIWYLDPPLRKRLFEEHGVKPFSILQCMGDAIIIPAGAPHQVKNLNSCIKVATDFVSPENVDQCFQLTKEFRKLPDTHINHEDKLQIKNIVYHAIKDSLSYLQRLEQGEVNDSATDEDDSVPLDDVNCPSINGSKVNSSSPSSHDKEKNRAQKKLAVNGSKSKEAPIKLT